MKMKSRVFLGILLLAGGALLLLQRMNIIYGDWENIFWTVIFGFTSFFLLSFYFSRKRRWWWLIGGIAALGGLVTNLLDLTLPDFAAIYNDLILLGFMGLSFIAVYLSDRIHWWAVLPGGVLITLGAVTFFEDTGMYGLDGNAVFLFGLGLTFLLLFLIPTKIGRLKWPLVAAIPLMLVGAYLAYQGEDQLWQYAGPVIILLAGIYFIASAFIRRSEKNEKVSEPVTTPNIEVIYTESNENKSPFE